MGWRSDLALQQLVRDTGVEVDYRYKLENIDLWETVVITNNKSALTERPAARSRMRESPMNSAHARLAHRLTSGGLAVR
jgi:hypothetical protein